MGTNYYFVVTNINVSITKPSIMNNLEKDIFDKLQEHLSKISTIHIGKRSNGRKPIFYRSKYYSSVKEIKEFYQKNKENLKIIDEYGNVLTFEELEKELINWNKDNDKAKQYMDSEIYYLDDEGYKFSVCEFS